MTNAFRNEDRLKQTAGKNQKFYYEFYQVFSIKRHLMVLQ